jgi:hypothetical protein
MVGGECVYEGSSAKREEVEVRWWNDMAFGAREHRAE